MVRNWKEALFGAGVMAFGFSTAPVTAFFGPSAGLVIGGPFLISGLFGEEVAEKAVGMVEEAIVRYPGQLPVRR